MTFAHGKCALSCIYDCFIRIYSICIILLCIIYLNYSKWDFAIQLCLHKTMRKFRVQLYLLILAFSSQLEKVVKLEIFFEFLQNSWAVICTCARQTEQPSNLITMLTTNYRLTILRFYSVKIKILYRFSCLQIKLYSSTLGTVNYFMARAQCMYACISHSSNLKNVHCIFF